MNAPVTTLALPAVGEPLEGGFFAGRIRVGEQHYALIVSPRVGDIAGVPWHDKPAQACDAYSFSDGLANTLAMSAAGSPLASRILSAEIGGHTGWYLPARDELEVLYRAFKPTTEHNWCRSGDNPSAIPVGYAYRPAVPPVTRVPGFLADEPEAFQEATYWSSTRYAGVERHAWCQGFGDGGQIYSDVDLQFRARPVRRLPL